ncbi:hypothetical protein OWM54_28300 [Myxococcus sp. MISCRS1]|jgi:hypothetical protein|uniref:hypothetical protein n=1 Tax=Myxococcus TaxID=32 RepID=UPI001CBC102D|nr:MULTISPECIES: hypothetical protein [unclassified Myxococcus]MBZ4394089.1 hypothetical protein [Myxococcus sp. AS-1-15]MCY1001058.1 hypothetical protein [Myxococcus sp. MISCRS1]BDT37382.1 hypothetical protein MFMH1_70510 [Myxococcus sp. MH1]
MRITSSLIAAVAALTLSITGCGGGAPSEPEQAPEAISSEAPSSEGEVSAMAICPQKWTCNSTSNYYGTLETCTAACGTNICYRDFDCRGACFCP